MALDKFYMARMVMMDVATKDINTTPESRVKILGDSIARYIKENLEVTWIWTGIHEDTGVTDPITQLKGSCSYYKINLTPSNISDHQGCYDDLSSKITLHTRATCKLKVDSGYWSGSDPITCFDFPDLIIPVSIFSHEQPVERKYYFDELCGTIIDHFLNYHPSQIIYGTRSKHKGVTSLCNLK